MRKIILFLSIIFGTQVLAQQEISWNPATDISANTYGNMYPRMTLDASGNPVIVWGDMAGGSVYVSRWTGSSFSTPLKLNPPWLKVASASWMGPDIASKGDTVYVVVKRTPETSDTNRIFIFRSFNGGISFSPPTELAFIGDSLSRLPTVSVDENGNPAVAFMKFDPSFLKARWVVATSTDFGNTFSTDVKAGGFSGPGSEACDCCPGALVSSGSTLAMLYRDNLSNIRDIWTGISTDNGLTFSMGFAADDNNWMVLTCPASGPDGVIIGDTLYATYMSAGNGFYRTYLSRSSISTGAMGSKMNLTGTVTGLSQQNYPRIASDGNAMAIVWKQTVSGNAQLPIMFTSDISSGFPTGYDTVDLANITNTDVALNKGNIFVIWQDDQTKTVKFRQGTFTPTVSIKPVNKPVITVYPNPASSIISIQADFDWQQSEVSIFNLLGEKILTENSTDQKILRVDISELKAGIYFIHIHKNGLIYTQKFVRE